MRAKRGAGHSRRKNRGTSPRKPCLVTFEKKALRSGFWKSPTYFQLASSLLASMIGVATLLAAGSVNLATAVTTAALVLVVVYVGSPTS